MQKAVWGEGESRKVPVNTETHKYLPSLSIKKFQSRGRGTLAYSH